jgi:predicted small secreted protein
MKNLKRLIALALTIVLCAGCFAGCGDNKPQGTGDATKDIEIPVTVTDPAETAE